jgi:hypothetical protein
MVLVLEGANANAVRTLQLFISEGAWEDGTLLKRHWQEVDQDLGEEEGVLTVDGSDFLKQGQESVGVKRQYCGEVGKRATCQAGVYLGYASRKGYTLLDRRLYMPQEWIEDEAYAERRRKCVVPADLPFKTKPTLGGEMIQAVHQAGGLRCRWVTGDEAFGRDTAFREQVAGWLVVSARCPTTRRSGGSGRRPRARLVRTGALTDARPPGQRSPCGLHRGGRWPRRCQPSTGRVRRSQKGVRGHWSRSCCCAPSPCARAARARGLVVLRRHVMTGELKTYLSHAPGPYRCPHWCG